VDITLNFS